MKQSLRRPIRAWAAVAVLLMSVAVGGAEPESQPTTLPEAIPSTAPASMPAAASQPAATSQPATAPADVPAAPKPSSLNIWELFVKGGIFMYPLTACSVLAVAIILERFIALRRSAINPPEFFAGLRSAGRTLNDRQRLIDYCVANDSPIARTLAAGLRRLPRGIAAAEKAMEDAGANEAIKLRGNVRLLYALGSVATLLGLIGTISGMIQAFEVTATANAEDAHRIENLSTGIYQAMVNTFAGLAVAVVATIFYYILVGKIERLIAGMNDTLSLFSDEYGFNESEAAPNTTNRPQA